MSEAKEARSLTHRVTRIETALESFMVAQEAATNEMRATITRFADNVEKRFSASEAETAQSIKSIVEELRTQGKPNLVVWLTALGLILTILLAVGAGWVHPLQVDIDNMKQQRMVDRQGIHDEFSERLNEMKEGLRSRDELFLKREDDVTGRVDRLTDDGRRSLAELRDYLLVHPPATK